MTLLRMCALAGVVWSPPNRRFDILGIHYYKGNKAPKVPQG